MRSHVLLGALAGRALAQVAAYGQCGGGSYSGSTTCASGYVCCYQNEWYSQCLPSSSCSTASTSSSSSCPTAETLIVKVTSSRTSSSPATTLQTSTKSTVAGTTTTSSAATTATTATSSTGTLKWFGVDESGAEFGTAIPGAWGTDFTFPSEDSLSTLMAQGFNIFRLPFLMERMAPSSLTGTLGAAYLANYTAIVNYITGKGGYAIIDPHNFGRYSGSIITDVSGFQTFWQNVATQFASNANAIFDTNNEYHDMDQTLVLNLNQAAIDGIRAAGATSQYIFVEGNSYSGAWTWNTTNTNLAALTDSENKIVYEMHQYLDSDGSGTSATCVSSDIGVQRVVGATAWLRANGKLGFLGEYAGGANSVCETAVAGMLDHLQANSDVWLGACWWGGGPWWGDYIFSFEPPSGTGYAYYDELLVKYAP